MQQVWQILIDRGISAEELELLKHSLLLLLMLPFVSTVVGIARHIIGISSLSIYAPIVLTFALFEISFVDGQNYVFQGLKLGTILFYTVLLTSALLYYFLIKQLRMHYIPKTSLVITGVGFTVAFLLFLSAYFNKTGFFSINTFTLIMIVVLAERFMTIFPKKNFKYAFFVSTETFLMSALCYLIITLNSFQDLLKRYPYIVLVTILINIFVGRFTGLRVTEYWRFKDLLLKQDVDNNNNSPK